MLIRARYLLPDADSPALHQAWVRIRDGHVEALGGAPGERPSPDPGEELLDLGDSLLMPGLVMAHTHVDYGLFRAHQDGADFTTWIQELTRRKQEDFDEHGFLTSARLSALELVAAGVTGVAEATDPGESAVQALVESGLRAVCYQEDFGPHPDQRDETMDRMRSKLDRLEQLATGSRVRVGVSAHAPYTLSEGLFEALVEEARARGMGLSAHLAETREEDDFVRLGTGRFADWHRKRGIPVTPRLVSPYRYLADRGWLDDLDHVLLVHGVTLEASDLEDLGQRPGVHLVHCPRSNARLGCGVAPIPAALAAGVSLLIGTDGACSADRLDPFEEMRAALMLARAVARDPSVIDARRVLAAAFRGAPALGFGPGRLEPGAPGDLCALGLDGPHLLPFTPDPAGVVLLAGAAEVRLTMVEGEVLYRDGEYSRVDAAAVLAEARRLGASAGSGGGS